MPPKRSAPDDPHEWLNRARSNLLQAGMDDDPDVYLEDLCFQSQQAAEKAIKALLLSLEGRFPYIHDLAELIHLVEKSGVVVPEAIKQVAKLNDFAVEARYPGVAEPVGKDEYREALRVAQSVVLWVGNHLKNKKRKKKRS